MSIVLCICMSKAFDLKGEPDPERDGGWTQRWQGRKAPTKRELDELREKLKAFRVEAWEEESSL